MGCYKDGDFHRYFKENMNDLGLPVPEGIFDSYTAATSNVTVLFAALKTLGSGATMGELVGATVGFEKLLVAGAVGASYYLGAAVGSVAVATGRSLSCGTRMSDLFALIEEHDMEFSNWDIFFQANPGIIQPGHPSRRMLAARGTHQPQSFEFSV
ncbi:hypothetical protein ACFOZ5_05850 [Marinobacter lacisalsi]|uniref:Uncharacterized protein n=1 Tax=Marinobacter lacisalsi TaxID=475979 RepID=A0ABV8QHL6_9GAMM